MPLNKLDILSHSSSYYGGINIYKDVETFASSSVAPLGSSSLTFYQVRTDSDDITFTKTVENSNNTKNLLRGNITGNTTKFGIGFQTSSFLQKSFEIRTATGSEPASIVLRTNEDGVVQIGEETGRIIFARESASFHPELDEFIVSGSTAEIFSRVTGINGGTPFGSLVFQTNTDAGTVNQEVMEIGPGKGSTQASTPGVGISGSLKIIDSFPIFELQESSGNTIPVEIRTKPTDNDQGIIKIRQAENTTVSIGDDSTGGYHLISGSGAIFASLSLDNTTANKTVMYNTSTGQFFYSGSFGTGGGGGGGSDNLGNHTAEEDLDLAGFNIKNVANITSSGIISASGESHILGFKSITSVLGAFQGGAAGNNGLVVSNNALITGNITSSGILSASGGVITNDLTVAGTTTLNGDTITGDISASGGISASKVLTQDIVLGSLGSIFIKDIAGNTDDTAIVNGSDVGIVFGDSDMPSEIDATKITLDASSKIILDSDTDSIDIRGNITASNNISASGQLSATSVTGFIAGDSANRVLTSDGDGTFTAEDSLTFDGTTFNLQSQHINMQASGDGFDLTGNITASGNVSASGNLFANLADNSDTSFKTVMYDTTTGKFFRTGSYGAGGTGTSITGTDTHVLFFDGDDNPAGDSGLTYNKTTDTLFVAGAIEHAGDANTGIFFDSDTITLKGNNAVIAQFDTTQIDFRENLLSTGEGIFHSAQLYDYGNQNDVNATSGFRVNSDKAYTHVTPQPWSNTWCLTGVPIVHTGQGNGYVQQYPRNYMVFGESSNLVMINPGVQGDGDGGPGDIKPDIGGGLVNVGIPTMIIKGLDLELIPSGANVGGNTAGIRIASGDVSASVSPGIFFYGKDNTTNISGSFFYSSASAEIRFDTGSNAVKFFAGSTTEDLKEVLHISKSGDNPRIGVGTNNPIRAFDFKEVRDDDRGGEILIRGSRSTIGAENNDEVGRINFAIDSASFGKIDTSGSAAEIVAIVDSVDQTGIQGHMSLRIANAKTGAPTEILKLSSSISVLNSPLDLNGALNVDLSNINASTINRYNNTSTRIELASNHLEFYGNAYGMKISNTGIDANPNGLTNMDFRVRSDNDAAAILVDSGDDTITLGSGADTHVTASGNISASGQIIAEAGPTINTTLASDSATNIDTFNTSSNNGAIYDYTLFSAPSGARAGQCMVIHHNGNADFTDTSTNTLGSETSIPFFETAINGANVEVKIASGSGYTFRAFIKKL